MPRKVLMSTVVKLWRRYGREPETGWDITRDVLVWRYGPVVLKAYSQCVDRRVFSHVLSNSEGYLNRFDDHRHATRLALEQDVTFGPYNLRLRPIYFTIHHPQYSLYNRAGDYVLGLSGGQAAELEPLVLPAADGGNWEPLLDYLMETYTEVAALCLEPHSQSSPAGSPSRCLMEASSK